MARPLSYADALKVLGQDDSAVLDFAEKLVDGGLGALGVPDFFGVRSQLVSHGRGLLTNFRERVTGVSRLSRTERIHAAHQILIVTSFFDAVGETLDQPDSPVSQRDLEMTTDEQWQLMRPFPHGVAHSSRVPPGVSADHLNETHADFSGMAVAFSGFVKELAVWERLSPTQRGHLDVLLRTPDLVDTAEERYRDFYRQLAAEVSEFGVWVELTEHAHTRERIAGLDRGLLGMRAILEQMASHRPIDRRREELAAAYSAVLRRPVLQAAEAPSEFSLPTLDGAYLPPRGRLAHVGPESNPSGDDWWVEQRQYDDLQPVLASFLTSVDATDGPLVILGHPGSGKSKLTEMLAAQLPASDFLALRVELRSVQPDAPLHTQIEDGISQTLHTQVSWRDLADSADGALPVVILDGFDELLQATGVNRSDYLEQVREFQARQDEMGQPVAVIVTSRTVVADRMRFPTATPAIRLEPFDDDQIARMIDIWSKHNATALAARDLQPLPLESALEYRELAEQPLLLLMLLIYDSEDNALQRAEGTMSRSELYERLLTMFARREVTKHQPHLSDDDMGQAVDAELRRLEVAAMAMFARRRTSVTADELERDLASLFPEAAVRAPDAGLHGAVSGAHQVLGRFFFVHESRARRDDQNDIASVYEFLHATFGEYLVARLVAATMDELVANRLHARRSRFPTPLDDGLLYAVTSFAALPGRAAVVEFLEDILDRDFAREPDDRAEYRALLLDLFHEAPFPQPNRSFADYAPWRAPIAIRQAHYTANLVVLLALTGDHVDLTELYPGSDHPWTWFRALANQWRALANDEWHSLVDTLRVRHRDGWEGEAHGSIELERGDPVNLGECLGFEIHTDMTGDVSITNPYEVTVPYTGVTSRLLRATALRVNGTAARTFLMLGPYLRHVSPDPLPWYWDPDNEIPWTEIHDILELRLAPPNHDVEGRLSRYRRLLSTTLLGRMELLVLRQAADDLAVLRAAGQRDQHTALSTRALAWLGRAEGIVHGRLDRTRVEPVLDALRPHLEEATSPTDAERALTHIRGHLETPTLDRERCATERSSEEPAPRHGNRSQSGADEGRFGSGGARVTSPQPYERPKQGKSDSKRGGKRGGFGSDGGHTSGNGRPHLNND